MNHLINHLKNHLRLELSPPPELFQTDAPSEHAPDKQQGAGDVFARFWAAYPRRIGKGAARRAFAKATKAGVDPHAIIEGARRYGAERAGEDPRYTPHPAMWLSAERWLDEPAPRTGGPPIIDEAGNAVAGPPRRHATGSRPSYATMVYGRSER